MKNNPRLYSLNTCSNSHKNLNRTTTFNMSSHKLKKSPTKMMSPLKKSKTKRLPFNPNRSMMYLH
jgi:hypothetical protein